MFWCKLYLILSSILSILGLVCSRYILFTAFVFRDVRTIHEFDVKVADEDLTPKLDICYPQSETLKTVESIWSKTAEIKEAVHFLYKNEHLSFASDKFIHGNLACYSVITKTKSSGHLPGESVFEVELTSGDTASQELILFLHSTSTTIKDVFTSKVIVPRIYSGERKNVQITLSYSFIHESFLPAEENFFHVQPHCWNGAMLSPVYEKCLNENVKLEFGPEFASFYTTIIKRSDETLVKNSPLSKRNCTDWHYTVDCIHKIFVPKVHSILPNSVDKILLIREATPSTEIIEVPIYSLSELIIEAIYQLVYWILISPIPYLVVELTVKRFLSQKYKSISS